MHGTIIKPPRGSMVDRLHPHNRGCVAWWPMWEGSGTVVADVLGRGNGSLSDFTAGGEWHAGRDGATPLFSRVLDTRILPPAFATIANEWTISLRLRIEESTAVIYYPLGIVGGAVGIFVEFSENWGFFDGQSTISGRNLNDFQWYDLAIVRRSTSYTLYVDGIPDGGGTLTSIDVSQISIGERGDGFGNFVGRIDNVRIYNRALSQAEIHDLYLRPWASVIGWDGADLVPVFGGVGGPPALPTANLTLHLDASQTDDLFTTFDPSGVHSGTPADGQTVEVWDDEGDGSVPDVCLTWPDFASNGPTFRSAAPLLPLPCLDFDGTQDELRAYTQDGGLIKAASNFIAADAFTILVAFLPESVTDTGQHFDAHALLGDVGGFFGISLRDNTGQKVLQCWNWDGTADSVDLAITTGQSHVVMFRHEAGSLFASLDGGAESSVASGNTTQITAQLALGKTTAGSAFYNGRIGEIAFYNAALAGTALSDAITYFTDKWLAATPPAVGPRKGSLALLGCGR